MTHTGATMSAEEVSAKARSLFPFFKAEGEEWAFFENAGGSQVRYSISGPALDSRDSPVS